MSAEVSRFHRPSCGGPPSFGLLVAHSRVLHLHLHVYCTFRPRAMTTRNQQLPHALNNSKQTNEARPTDRVAHGTTVPNTHTHTDKLNTTLHSLTVVVSTGATRLVLWLFRVAVWDATKTPRPRRGMGCRSRTHIHTHTLESNILATSSSLALRAFRWRHKQYCHWISSRRVHAEYTHNSLRTTTIERNGALWSGGAIKKNA